MYLIGYDIGSSSVKAALVDAQTKATVGVAQHPEREMAIRTPLPDWAEQDPEDWWQACCAATRQLLEKTRTAPSDIASIGIAYQMHGLVALDREGKVLRPAIIWCDSRAVPIGQAAFEALGKDFCLQHYLNSPGNFTAAKLRWVKENEPDVFAQTYKIMLPGDYIAFRMTGEARTTVTGLSEAVLWDFKNHLPAQALLDHWGLPTEILPECVGVFAEQGRLRPKAAEALGLRAGTTVGYRAGDQPNNALALNALRPGDVAATGGTSGVVYAVAAQPVPDPEQGVNSFAHVNYSPEMPLTGILLCINGAGSAYRWAKDHLAGSTSYADMEHAAATAPIGAGGLSLIPFGNGAERMLGNQNIGASLVGLQFNRHGRAHLFRAFLEGIAFAFAFGIKKMQGMDMPIQHMRTGNDNLFRSAVFAQTLSNATGLPIDVLDTTGAVGAALAAGVAVGAYGSPEEAVASGIAAVASYLPQESDVGATEEACSVWEKRLHLPS